MDNKNKFLEEMSDNGKTHNKKLIVILGAAVIIGAVIVTIALGGVIFKKINGDKKLSPTVVYELTSQQATVAATGEGDGELDLELSGGTASVSDSVVGNTQSGSVTSATSSNKTEGTTKPNTTKNQAVEHYEQLSPNGENVLSDHFENKFIKQISQDYGVDSDLLVAIYSEPDTGNNFVLEFSGKKDSSGTIIKSPDTLSKVYQIDQNGGVKIATGQN
ncbi:MAG: hypothetical protein J6Q83_01540, partial [Clostridia bacterium]|nr:hypothetical protein [Clostridia bacterium]